MSKPNIGISTSLQELLAELCGHFDTELYLYHFLLVVLKLISEVETFHFLLCSCVFTYPFRCRNIWFVLLVFWLGLSQHNVFKFFWIISTWFPVHKWCVLCFSFLACILSRCITRPWCSAWFMVHSTETVWHQIYYSSNDFFMVSFSS